MPSFTHQLRVRYNECDAQGVVFNANYLVYIDVSVTELFRDAFGSYDHALERYDVDVVVAEANVRFIAPARFDDIVEIDVTVEKLGTTSMTTRFDFRRGEEQLAVGHLRYVFVALDGSGKAPIPDEVRVTFERYG